MLHKGRGLVQTLTLRKTLICICLHFGNGCELCHEEVADATRLLRNKLKREKYWNYIHIMVLCEELE